MPYAILRFQKRKAGGVAACERHNERKKEAYKSNPDIDMERSKDNYHLVNPPRYTYKKEINRMVAEAGCRTRKDSVMMVETLITASPELPNSFTVSQLFICLNERILRQKSTIISTNLALDDIKTIYSERTFSRISSNYTILRITGDDIRIQKKLLNLGGTNDVTP